MCPKGVLWTVCSGIETNPNMPIDEVNEVDNLSEGSYVCVTAMVVATIAQVPSHTCITSIFRLSTCTSAHPHPHIYAPAHLRACTSTRPHIYAPAHLRARTHLRAAHIYAPAHLRARTSTRPHIYASMGMIVENTSPECTETPGTTNMPIRKIASGATP